MRVTGQSIGEATAEPRQQCGQIAYNLGHVLLGRGFLVPDAAGSSWERREFSEAEEQQIPFELRGADVCEISVALFISGTTARKYRSSILAKVGASGKRGFLTRRLIEIGFLEAPAPERLSKRWELSAREQQVLERSSYGDSIRGMADALLIDESTAGSHVAKLLEKLGAVNRVDAVYKGFGHGLLKPDYQMVRPPADVDVMRAHELLREAWSIMMAAPPNGPAAGPNLSS